MRRLLSMPPHSQPTQTAMASIVFQRFGGVYSLTLSAPGYARLTFRGLVVPQYTPLVIDANLSDATTSSDSVIVVKFTSSSAE
jgi:hypothetical protein